MTFDEYSEKPCNNPSANDPSDCPVDPIPQEPDPPIEPSYHLELKPGYALRQIGEPAQFKTYLVSDETGEEQEIVQGLTYRSDNPGIATVGALSGRAFGTIAGVVTVSVEWQDMMAYAQFEVTGDCADVKVGMMLVIDNSLSMGKVFTSPPVVVGQAAYATRLSFAKSVARLYAGEINEAKDYVGLISFGQASAVVEALTHDKAAVQDAATGIAQTSDSTDIGNAIGLAIQELENAKSIGTIDKMVVVIFSDGENKGVTDPVLPAIEFKGFGGVIVSVGVRAHGEGYELMSNLATDGMFVNALKTNATTVANQILASKGYYCAGNCQAQGNVTVAYGALNYAGFANWDVVTGSVDLIGGEYPYELYNLLPGNGLYVDMSGSGTPWLGKIRSKSQFALVSGRSYRLSFKLAGNQREDATGYTTRARVENPENSVDQIITINDFSQDFTAYTYTFVAPSSANARISFEQTAPAGKAYGNLLDEVVFEDLTVPAILIDDDFDSENQQFIEPECVTTDETLLGSGYGYCSARGCLDDPIGQQIPDPDQLPDSE